MPMELMPKSASVYVSEVGEGIYNQLLKNNIAARNGEVIRRNSPIFILGFEEFCDPSKNDEKENTARDKEKMCLDKLSNVIGQKFVLNNKAFCRYDAKSSDGRLFCEVKEANYDYKDSRLKNGLFIDKPKIETILAARYYGASFVTLQKMRDDSLLYLWSDIFLNLVNRGIAKTGSLYTKSEDGVFVQWEHWNEIR